MEYTLDFTPNFDSNSINENEHIAEEPKTDEDIQSFLQIGNLTDIDILDEALYSYDSMALSITPIIQQQISKRLFRKVEQFVDSITAVGKAVDHLTEKTEYIPRMDLLSDEIKQALQKGLVEMTPCKTTDDGSFYLQIRTAVEGLTISGKEYGLHKKVKDIPLGSKIVPVDTWGAMQCLATQNQLNQINRGLQEISRVCEVNFGRIIQGQRDDRLAKLLSARSSFVQALVISGEIMQKYMLQDAIRDANSARAMLAYQIHSDIVELSGSKSPKSKDMERIVHDIDTAIIAMNNAVQLTLYSYQLVGEHRAQLAVVNEHRAFIKQVLLKKIERHGKCFEAWQIICSSGNSNLILSDPLSLPTKLIANCTEFIESKKTGDYLEGESNE